MMGLTGRISGYLRAVRRAADLSQRDLAARSGVPLSTITRIEAAVTADPRISTLERLLTAAGCRLVIMHDDTALDPLFDAPVLRDRTGRRYPAHLDLQPVRSYLDWWYSVAHKKHPALPNFTYTTVRRYRDRQRVLDADRLAERAKVVHLRRWGHGPHHPGTPPR